MYRKSEVEVVRLLDKSRKSLDSLQKHQLQSCTRKHWQRILGRLDQRSRHYLRM